LRREVGAIGLDEQFVARDRGGGGTQGARLRVRDVPGERDVVAAFDGNGHERRGRETVEDDGAGEGREHFRRLRVRLAVVDDDGQPALVGELQLRREQP
jgi:hypothetical protein